MTKTKTTQPVPSTYGEVERTGDEPLTWELTPSNDFTSVRDVLAAISAKEAAKVARATDPGARGDEHGIPDPVPDCAA